MVSGRKSCTYPWLHAFRISTKDWLSCFGKNLFQGRIKAYRFLYPYNFVALTWNTFCCWCTGYCFTPFNQYLNLFHLRLLLAYTCPYLHFMSELWLQKEPKCTFRLKKQTCDINHAHLLTRMHQSAQHPAGNPTLSADAEPWHQAETIFSAQYDIIESVQGLSAIVPGHTPCMWET